MGRTASVIGRAIGIGRGRIRFLIPLAALVFVPLSLVDVLDQRAQAIDPDGGVELAAVAAGTTLYIVSNLLGAVLYAGAVMIAVLATPPGRDPSLRRIVRDTRWRPLIAIDLLFTIGTIVSLLLLVVPGVIFFSRYALASVVAELEGLGVRNSFRRSAELSKGGRPLVFGLLAGVAVVGDLVTGLVTDAAAAIGAAGFFAEWLASAAAAVLYYPALGLLSVALVVELGGRLPRPAAVPPSSG